MLALLCPVCRARDGIQERLREASPGVWQCMQGHHFDQARQGYLNLLPAQLKRSKDPGDSKPMVQARRRFLEGQHYAPVAAQLTDSIGQYGGSGPDLCILDAGCGEGYYLRQLQQSLPTDCQLFGNDVSKPAVQAAAPWHKKGHYVVASNARLPYPDASFGVLICAFGFCAEAEFLRVLKPDGVVITIDPQPGHLQALREVLYERDKTSSAQAHASLAGFQLAHQQAVTFSFALQQSELQDLLAMTPHAHRASQAGKQRLAALDALPLQADVVVRVWRVDSNEQSIKELT